MSARTRVVAMLAALAGLGLGCKGTSEPCEAGSATAECVEPTGTLEILAANLPAGGGSAVVTGPGGTPQTVALPATLGGVATGAYTVQGTEVETTPSTYEPDQATQSAAVQPNQKTTVTVSYRLINARVTSQATGLPAGREPPWSIAAPGAAGFGTALGRATVLSNLAPGSYRVRAGAFFDGASLYLPAPAAFSVDVVVGVNRRVAGAWSTGAAVTDVVAGTPVTGLVLAAGGTRIFRVTLPAGQAELRVALAGGTGDGDVYLRADAPPDFPAGVTCGSEGAATVELCVVPAPKAGPWFVQLAARTAVQGATLTITAAAVAPPAVVTLQGGPGSGRVRVAAAAGQAALDCVVTNGFGVGTCQGSYPAGTPLTVTATPAGPDTFTGWTSGCTGTTNPCQYVVAADATIRAGFAPAVSRFTLSVLAGAGSIAGVLTSVPVGINCTIDAAGQVAATGCAADFNAGTVVRLTPSGPNAIQSWGSACINTPATSPCDVTMSVNQAVVATFELPKPVVQVVSTLKRGAVGAIDPVSTFVLPIVNAGSGDLRIKSPLAPPVLNRGTGWITAAVQYASPTSSSLVLTITPDKLRPLGRADFTARMTLEAEGTGQTVDVDFSVRPLVNTSPVIANRVVYFHYEPTNPLKVLLTLLKVVGKNGASLTPPQVTFDVAANSWLDDVTFTGNSEVQLKTLPVNFDNVTPDGNTGGSVSIKVKTPTDKCDRIQPIQNKDCTILAYYTRDQNPEMELSPWGLVFSPATPGPLEVSIKRFNDHLGTLGPARIKSDDCGAWVTQKTIVAGAPEKVRVQVNFDAIPADTSFSCNLLVEAEMRDLGGFSLNDTTSRYLEIVATRPVADAVTPEYPDLKLLVTSATMSQLVLAYNFGAGLINLTGVTAAAGSCPNGLLGARISPLRNARLNDNRNTTAQVEVQLTRAGVPAGTVCTGSVTITATGGLSAVVPVTVKVP